MEKKEKHIVKQIVLAIFTLFSWLPLKVHYVLSDFLYFLFYKVFKYRIAVVTTNISRSFPDASYKEIEKITKKFYHSLCDKIVEVIWAYTRSAEEVSGLLDFGGTDVLNEAYSDGKNVIVLLGHQGNWELYTSLPNLKGFYDLKMGNSQFYYIYKKMSSKLSDAILYDIRSKHKSCQLVEKNAIVRMLLQNKNSGGVYYFIADQNVSKINGTELAFLGQSTYFFKGPEELARKLSLPVLFFDVDRVSRGFYKSKYIKICDDASLVPPGFITKEYARLLEESIQRDRSNWLWSHKRWKNIQ